MLLFLISLTLYEGCWTWLHVQHPPFSCQSRGWDVLRRYNNHITIITIINYRFYSHELCRWLQHHCYERSRKYCKLGPLLSVSISWSCGCHLKYLLPQGNIQSWNKAIALLNQQYSIIVFISENKCLQPTKTRGIQNDLNRSNRAAVTILTSTTIKNKSQLIRLSACCLHAELGQPNIVLTSRERSR